MKVAEIDYRVSLYPARDKEGHAVLGRWNVCRSSGVKRITLYLGQIWQARHRDEKVGEYGLFDVDNFTTELIQTIVLETVCIERAGEGIRIKDRCKPYCKMWFFTVRLLRQEGILCP